MGEEAEANTPEIVTTDDEVVGTVGEMLWQDAGGFDVVTVAGAGPEVVIPLAHGQAQMSDPVSVRFTAAEVRDAPSVGELMARGGDAAVRLVADHYDLNLTGPPPGPVTSKLPPWWTRTAAEGDDQGRER
jgi:hypothetical protein